ncbi:hypothetical protein [Streptomyces sp. BH105]|uniref:hypothetical protein n=1 Tax=Streptomyces sp. BH105 TaxID=3410408 RepID=UPI003CF00352
MGDIAKGVLGGAWTLLVGWILPTALTLSIFFFTVTPSLKKTGLFEPWWPTTQKGAALLLLSLSLLFGIVFSSLQNALYRILEGYLLWPQWLCTSACNRSLRMKHHLSSRIRVMRLERRSQLSDEERQEILQLTSNPHTARVLRQDRRRNAVQRSLLQERLSRYPINDDQIAPTRLGNAIRRFEEYGYNRFRLDTQVMWHELTSAAPEQTRRQVGLARTNVDFFVALLVGHIVVSLSALAACAVPQANTRLLLATSVALILLCPIWYRSAVSATDEWAASVRALVNVGRKPLAESLGLALPARLEDERTMWSLVVKMSRLAYHERASALDAYRVDPNLTAGEPPSR